MPFSRWWRIFAGTLGEDEARATYARQIIPAPGRAIAQAAFSNVMPHSPASVNFHNPSRAPLLIVGGEKDVIMPASLSRKIYRKHAVSPATTDYKEFPGRSHSLILETGWEEVAHYALSWAERHSSPKNAGTSQSSLPASTH